MRMLADKPVLPFLHDYVATPVTTAAWVQLIASLSQPTSALEIFNGTGSVVKISTGTAADEDNHILPYYILPGGSSIMLPVGFAKTTRLSARAVDQDATTGVLVLNFFG